MEPKITIKHILNTDRNEIHRIAASCTMFTSEEVLCVLDLWDDSQNYPSQPDPYLFLGAYKDKKLIGFSCYGHRALTSGVYDLYWIAVEAGQQEHGIGRKLLKATETSVRRHKGSMLLIETSDTPAFEPTRRFYVHADYLEGGRVPNFYQTGDGLVIYYKELKKIERRAKLPKIRKKPGKKAGKKKEEL